MKAAKSLPYAGPIVTRSEAKAAGLKRYMPGTQCLSGHVAERLTSTGNCLECSRIRSRKITADAKERLAAAKDRNASFVCDSVQIPSTRAEAFLLGVDRYNTGKPCKNGHISDRYTVSMACYQCLLEHQREWQKANPDAVRVWQRAKYVRRREEFLEKTKKWREENREARRAHHRNRKAKLRKSNGFHTEEDIARIYKAQRGKCAYCAVPLSKGYHVDHVVPLFLGGSNWPRNLQLCCFTCNLRKNSRRPEDFARQMGKLI